MVGKERSGGGNRGGQTPEWSSKLFRPSNDGEVLEEYLCMYRCYYGLNARVLPNSYVEIITANVIV